MYRPTKKTTSTGSVIIVSADLNAMVSTTTKTTITTNKPSTSLATSTPTANVQNTPAKTTNSATYTPTVATQSTASISTRVVKRPNAQSLNNANNKRASIMERKVGSIVEIGDPTIIQSIDFVGMVSDHWSQPNLCGAIPDSTSTFQTIPD